ncbi:GbsR/MarR family transcriptional regulator [Rariglobus hedericola]|uniref:Transcriptional regulator n=1 Tax=Rariglobus hedericola TaxID=2597822 RepID=A0A556QQP7_9BACT|nr:transcriptional regulator [Rariglobus hedericola]TSJ78968.1 transcriptional regulator [Rariglobus hedericola]
MSRSTPTSNSRSPLPVADPAVRRASRSPFGGTRSAVSTDPSESGFKSQVSTLSIGEREVIAIFVQMSQALGAPRSLGEIYGLLFATPEPLPFQEIADRLKLSKGSVSQGLRFLRTVGAIKPVVIAQDRREFFEPVVELRALVGGFLKERLNPQLEEWGARVKTLRIEDFAKAEEGRRDTDDRGQRTEDGEQKTAVALNFKLSSSTAATDQQETLSNRLDKLKTWHKRANTVLPMIGKLLG